MKKKRNVFILLIMLMTIFGCSCKEKYEYDDITIKDSTLKRIEKAENYTDLLDLREKYTLHPDYGIGRIIKIKINDKYIGLIGKGSYCSLYIFRKSDGKFLGRTGDRGKGPGDYMTIHHFTFFDKNKILVLDGLLDRVSFYEINEGEIIFNKLENINDEEGVFIWIVEKLKNKYYGIVNSNSKGNNRILIFNNNFDIIKKFNKFEHTSFVVGEPAVFKNDRIYIAQEMWHKNIASFKTGIEENMKCSRKLDVYDLEGNFIKSIDTYKEKKVYSNPIYFNKKGTLMLTAKRNVVDINGNLIKRLKEKKRFKNNEKLYMEMPLSSNCDGDFKTYIPDRFTDKDDTIIVKVYDFLRE